MKFELFIAKRLRLSTPDSDGRDKPHASPGAIIAIAGIAVSFIVMLLSIAVMMGFKHDIKAKLMGFDSQIMVYPPSSPVTGVTPAEITLSDTLSEIIESTLPGSRLTLTVTRPVIFKTTDDFQGMILRGLANEDEGRFIRDNLTAGTLPDFTPDSAGTQVVIPSIMANKLSLGVGDKVHAYFINGDNVKVRRMSVTGIYDTHFSDYDKVYAFAPTRFLQTINGMAPNQASIISLTGFENDDEIDRATERLASELIDASVKDNNTPLYQTRNIHQTGAAYFSWLALLDTNVVVILVLMALVAGFTLISSLFIIILERVNMIGVLRALGASNNQIRKIFIIMAERLVVRGLLIGNIISLGFIALQHWFHVIPLNPESYYLNYVPVSFDVTAWLLLNVGVVIIACIMLILPTHIVATIKPSKVIKYD
jgi:ABC-type transport system, involved in lipoprotein release, permease component